MFKTLSDNRAFQTLVGAGVCYAGFLLWRDGWFNMLFAKDEGGFSNPALIPMAIAAVASALQLVGIVAIPISSGLLSLFSPLLNLAIESFNKAKDKLARKKLPGKVADKVDDADVPRIDSQKLNDVLNDMNKRLASVELWQSAKSIIDENPVNETSSLGHIHRFKSCSGSTHNH